jgi:hypothetical protein
MPAQAWINQPPATIQTTSSPLTRLSITVGNRGAIGGVVTDGAGCWVVEFYDFTTEAGQLDGELAHLGDVDERARRNGAR